MTKKLPEQVVQRSFIKGHSFPNSLYVPEVDLRAGSRFTSRKCNYARFLSKHKEHVSIQNALWQPQKYWTRLNM